MLSLTRNGDDSIIILMPYTKTGGGLVPSTPVRRGVGRKSIWREEGEDTAGRVPSSDIIARASVNCHRDISREQVDVSHDKVELLGLDNLIYTS